MSPLPGEPLAVSKSPVRITERALVALREEGPLPAQPVLVIQHVLGCGGSGYRIRLTDRPLDDGVSYEVPGPGDGNLPFRISLDAYSNARLEGAAIDYDPEKETEGFLLDHPDAAFAAFC